MTQNEPNDLLRLEDIRHDYPRFYPISQIHLYPTDNQSQIDLRNTFGFEFDFVRSESKLQ